MRLTMVVAIGQHGEMGLNNALPWSLPSDLRHFKETTLEGVLIMGRKTFESLPGLLPKRQHIVLSRQKDLDLGPKVSIAHSLHCLEELLEERYSGHQGFVIGGSEVFTLLAPFTDKAYISHVEAAPQADVYFPLELIEQFSLKTSLSVTADLKDQYKYSLCCYEI